MAIYIGFHSLASDSGKKSRVVFAATCLGKLPIRVMAEDGKTYREFKLAELRAFISALPSKAEPLAIREAVPAVQVPA